jgi:hypothetical protein
MGHASNFKARARKGENLMGIRASLLLLTVVVLAVPASGAGPVTLVRGDAGDRLLLDPALGASWQDVNIGRLVVRTPGRQERLDTDDRPGPSAKTRALMVKSMPTSGCALIIADLGPGFDKGRPDAWQRITHATKIVSCAGGDGPARLSLGEIEARRHAGSMLMAKTGSRVEIQPMANPATLRPGADMPVRAYCDGAARLGVEVAAIAPDGSRRYATTGAVGTAVLHIDAAGRWRFEVTCTPRSATADAPPLVASLVVDVLSNEAWSNLEAGR